MLMLRGGLWYLHLADRVWLDLTTWVTFRDWLLAADPLDLVWKDGSCPVSRMY